MTSKVKAILASLPILVILGILVFASASEATNPTNRRIPKVTEDSVLCRPQRSSSADLWTCYDYYGNQFKDLQISILIK
jgi:hypothetical protein